MDRAHFDFDSPAPLAQAGYGWQRRLLLHRNEGIEVLYLEHGHLKWVVDGEVTEVGSESVFYTFPWELHGSAEAFEPGHFWHYAVLRGDLRPSQASKNRPLSFQRFGLSKSRSAEMMRTLQGATKRCWPASPRIVTVIKELVNEAKEKKAAKPQKPRSNEASEALGKLLLVELTRIVSEGKEEAKSPLQFTQRVQRVLRQINAHPEEEWTLASMAAAAGLHRTHFTNAVRHATGDTPLAYLRRTRVNQACKMLRTTKALITEIALACGFDTSQHFARSFRQFSEQSASEYRKSSRRS